MKNQISFALACLLGVSTGQDMFLQQVTDDPLAWRDKSKSAEERATLLVAAMNFTEKAQMMTRSEKPTKGVNDWTGGIAGIERLKVPEIRYQDGPQGFRDELNHGTSTAWPSVQAFGQTWDPELLEQWGQAMGKEFKEKGAAVQLGPGMNVMRIGENGRDFEYVSGEDPHLGAQMVGSIIKGIQSNGIMANMKHFINNNQEINRMGQSANIDERTQVEMYMPPFEAAVKAGVGSAMCSYNKINNIQSCANNHTLNYLLREKLGFEGFVMSDWGAVYGGPKDYVAGGCDQEQDFNPKYFTPEALKAEVPEQQMDTAVHRIVKSFIQLGLYDEELPDNFSKNVTSEEHRDLAKHAVEQSTVLLQNKGNALPLDNTGGKNILVIGNQAKHPVVAGGGSGVVYPSYVMPPIHAVCDWLGIERINAESWIDRKCAPGNGNCVTYVSIVPTNGQSIFGSEQQNKTESEIVAEVLEQMGSKAFFAYDATLVFTAIDSQEGSDRKNLKWNELILYVLKMIPFKGKVVASMVAPGPIILTDIMKDADAILYNSMPGEQYAMGVMSVIFGATNPSAKLTFTMPKIDNEQKRTLDQYPGRENNWQSDYTEKHHFGYRWYDQNMVKPAFEFGHGLSYTEFKYSALSIDSKDKTVTFNVTNVGKVKGSEVAQVYISVPKTENFSGGYRSVKALKAFSKVKDLEQGATRRVTITLDDRAFSYWDVKSGEWKVENGEYGILVGASSRDIRLSAHMTI